MRDSDLTLVSDLNAEQVSFSFLTIARSVHKVRMRDYSLTLVPDLKAERESLNFSPDETLFIPINRHVTWNSPFSSGALIGS